MRLATILSRALALALGGAVLAGASMAHAGSFNCAVVYDEFESLMNKQFLRQPDQFVRTLPGRISRQQFEGVSNADFLLYPNREGMGIGVLTTNKNIHAKFLFRWSEPLEDDASHLIIEELVKYGRVSDGYAPSRAGPFRLKPGMALDVDSGEYVPMEQGLLEEEELARKKETGDLLYEVGTEGTVLKSVNGARVQFPLETMCQQGSA